MPHKKDKASDYHAGNGTFPIRITPKGLTITGMVAGITAIISGFLWASDNLSEIKKGHEQIDTNKQDIVMVVDAAKETNKNLQVQDKRLTIMETEHKAMMESIRQSSVADRVIMEDIKDLMKKMINGGHKHD